MADLVVYFCVADARSALAWYVENLGAKVLVEPVVMDDDRVGHAEFSVEGVRFMMSEAFPELNVEAPLEGRGAAATFVLIVDDVLKLTTQLQDRGVALDRTPDPEADRPITVFRDPEGHRWMIAE